VFSIFTATFYILLTSYVADTLIGVLQTGSNKRLEYEAEIEKIGKFMREKTVAFKLQTLVVNYF
jgi:hypothetical protein